MIVNYPLNPYPEKNNNKQTNVYTNLYTIYLYTKFKWKYLYF